MVQGRFNCLFNSIITRTVEHCGTNFGFSWLFDRLPLSDPRICSATMAPKKTILKKPAAASEEKRVCAMPKKKIREIIKKPAAIAEEHELNHNEAEPEPEPISRSD